MLAIAATIVGLQSCDDDKKINPDKLPDTAEKFITDNFPEATISSVVKKYDGFVIHYNAYLSDGTYIEFSKDGDWKEVVNRVSGVPSSIIPEKIASYVAENYNNALILEIKRDKHYEVELSSGIELVFDLDGNFLHFDY